MAIKMYRALATQVANTVAEQSRQKWVPIGSTVSMDEARAAGAVANGALLDLTPAPAPPGPPGAATQPAPTPAPAPTRVAPMTSKDLP